MPVRAQYGILDDGVWMSATLNQFKGSTEKFTQQMMHVVVPSKVLLLGLGDFCDDFCNWVTGFQSLDDTCTIIGEDLIAHPVNEHHVHALWTKCSPHCFCISHAVSTIMRWASRPRMIRLSSIMVCLKCFVPLKISIQSIQRHSCRRFRLTRSLICWGEKV